MLAHRLADAAAFEPSAEVVHEIDSVIALSELLGSMTLGVHSAHHGALLLVLRADTDLAQITATLQRALGIEVIDRLDAQVQELCKIRRPREKLSREALEWDARQLCPARTRLHYGVWAFYPWSRRLVHLVNEPEFIELRTNRNLYKISPAEQRSLQSKLVGIVGASAGQAVALTLASERSCGEIRLADFDHLDATNLNRLRGGIAQLGVSKVVVAAREIAEIDPFLRVRCFEQGIHERNIAAFLCEGGNLDMVVEECDSLDIKFLVREHARARHIPVLMDTSDRGLIDVERFDLEPSRPLFHGLAPSLDRHALAALTTEEKIPHMLDLLGVDNTSTRLKASMLEIEHSVTTWPQLASSVIMGGAVAADTVRRILLGEAVASGRYYIDLQQLIPAHDQRAEAAKPPVLKRAHYRAAELERCFAALPHEGTLLLDPKIVEALVAAGVSAPSGGNAQPWRWAYSRGTLLLLRDQASESFLDVGARGSYAALGAAAENVCLAAASRRMRAQCRAFPIEGDEQCVAALRFFAADGTHAGTDAALAEQIFRRRTDRRLGTRSELPSQAVAAMQNAIAAIPGARLQFVAHRDGLAQLEHILGVTQQMLLQHSASHRQMMSEIQWDDPQAQASERGIALPSLALSALDRAGLDLCRDYEVLRLNQSWGGGTGLRRFAEKAVRAAAGFALISMPGGDARAYFDGGRAMQRAWLAACAHDLAVHPLSALPYLFARARLQPDSLPDWVAQSLAHLWPGYAQLFDVHADEAGVLLFKLSRSTGALPPSAPRLPVARVLRYF